MILFTFKNKATLIDDPGFDVGISARRWIFEVSPTEIGFNFQCHWRETGWGYAGMYYVVSLTKYWHWGRHHAYYDGPRDGFSIGFIHFNWSGRWCQKCYDGDE